MRHLILLGALGLAACVDPDVPTGAEDFATFCAACHGMSGKGDGEGGQELARAPADLTQLSARNGGVFPGTAVMAKIWGYTGTAPGRQDSAAVMPEFGPLLQGDLVPYDGGDGIATPTPIRLVQLAEHVRSLQGK
jgi:mono/diheme cytochrome c family protein